MHKSVLPPTGADACVSCFFTPPNSNNNDFKEAFENDDEMMKTMMKMSSSPVATV